jgi:hypothetical protein
MGCFTFEEHESFHAADRRRDRRKPGFSWCLGVLVVNSLVAAVLIWRDRAKSKAQRRRLVLATCASGFVAVAIAEASIAIWH